MNSSRIGSVSPVHPFRLIALFTAFVAGGLVPLAAQAPTLGGDRAAAEAVSAREIAFAATMATRDFDAFLTFISDDAVFYAGATVQRGRDAIGEAWRPFFDGADAPFSWHPDSVESLDSGDLALSTGPVRDPSGQTVGRFNSVWRLEADGVWRVVFDKGCP